MSVTSTARVRVSLLGHPDLRRDGRSVALATRNAVLLVARLALEGPQTRELLSSLLWPDAEEARGRTNLRRTLVYVRQGFGRDVEVVRATGSTLTLASGVATDLQLVRQALEAQSSPARLAEAVAVWRGELLEGVQADGEEMDAWLAQQREHWSQRLALACERLAAARSRAGDGAGALDAVETWLERDPLAETAHRERIRIHLARGDGPAALEAYERCADLLQRELGIRPSPATREVAERAREGETEAGAAQPQARPEVPMLGREGEHTALAEAFERAAGGSAEIVLITGEAGIGKTRLLREFVVWARAHGAEVLEVRPFPSARRIAYQAVGDIIGEAVAGGEGDDLRLLRGAAEHLDRLAQRRLIVLAVDDLQWVDPDSLELLLFVATALARRDRRLLVLAAVRDDDLAGSADLRDWTARAARELRLVEAQLHPLSPDQAERLIALWPQLAGGAVEGLAGLCGGRPLLLVESLRHLAAGGNPGAIAPSVRASMTARLSSLTAGARRLVDAAAVLEKPASLANLAAVAGVDAEAASVAIGVLLTGHVLAGQGSYSVSHELLRQSAYSALPLEVRRRLHAAALRVLEGLTNGSVAELARHAELAGRLDLALDLRLRAASEAMALPAYRAAADQYRAAIAIEADVLEAWLGLGRAEELSGRSDLAADTYRRLADRSREAGRPSDEAAALVRLSELAGRDLAAVPPTELIAAAAEAADDAADEGLRLEAELAEAQVLAYRGSLARARSAVQAAQRRAARTERSDLVARCLNLAAFIAQAEGRWEVALPLARQAASAYRALGEQLMVLDSIGYEVASLVFLGRWRDALRRVRRPLDEAARLDNPWAVCNLSLGEAWALRDGGRLEEALASAERGVAAAVRAGFVPLQVLNGALAGRCRRELGELSGAARVHQEMLQIARNLDGVAMQCVLEELTADAVTAGDWEAAASWAGQAIARWGEMRMFAFLSLWTVAEACLRSNAAFTIPTLPAGDRYGLVDMRTRAVLAQHAGAQDEAARYRQDCLALAEDLGLAVEAHELREEIALIGAPPSSRTESPG